MNVIKNIKPSIMLFSLGILGVFTVLPLIPQLLAMQSAPLPMSVDMILLISVLQMSLLLFLMIWLGSIFSKKVGLTSPIIFALANSGDIYKNVKPQIIPAIVGGVLGAMVLICLFSLFHSYLPAEYLNVGDTFNPTWYTKVFYGGITEEIILRWGLMSFFVWGIYRLTQKKDTIIKPHNYVFAIIITALIFGIGHIPTLIALSLEPSAPLVVYIIIGNSTFGLIAGYLYWKYGLECAMGAHMITHITLIACTGLY